MRQQLQSMKLTHKEIKVKLKAKLVFTILALISIAAVLGLTIAKVQIGFIWNTQVLPISGNTYIDNKYLYLHYQASFITEILAFIFILIAIATQIKVLQYKPQQNATQKNQNNKQTENNIDDKIENKKNNQISKKKQSKQIQNLNKKSNNIMQDQQILKQYYRLKMKQSWVILSLCQLSLLRPTIFYVTLVYEIIYKFSYTSNLFWFLNSIFSSLALIFTIIVMIIDYNCLSKFEDHSKILFQKQKEVKKEEVLSNKSQQIRNKIEDVNHIKDIEKPSINNHIQNSLKSLDVEAKLQKREPLIENKKIIIEKQKSNSNVLLMDSQSQPSFRPKKKRKKQIIQTEKQLEKKIQFIQPKQNKPIQNIKQQRSDTGGNHNHTHIYLGYPYGGQPGINNSLPNVVEAPPHTQPQSHIPTNYQNVITDNFSFNKQILKNKQALRNQKKKRKNQIQQEQISSNSSDESQKLRKHHKQIKRQKEIKRKQRQYEQLKRKIEQIKRQQQKQNQNQLQKQINRYETKLIKNIIQIPIRPIGKASNKPLKLQRQFQLQYKAALTSQQEPLIQIENSKQEKIESEKNAGQMKKGKFINRSLQVGPSIKQQAKIYPLHQELKNQKSQIGSKPQKFKNQNINLSQKSERSSKQRLSKNKKHTLSQYIADLNNLQYKLQQQYSSRLSDAQRNYISDNNYTSILNQVDEGKVPIERQQLQKISLSSIKKSVTLKDSNIQKQINNEHPLVKIYRKYAQPDKKYK